VSNSQVLRRRVAGPPLLVMGCSTYLLDHGWSAFLPALSYGARSLRGALMSNDIGNCAFSLVFLWDWGDYVPDRDQSRRRANSRPNDVVHDQLFRLACWPLRGDRSVVEVRILSHTSSCSHGIESCPIVCPSRRHGGDAAHLFGGANETISCAHAHAHTQTHPTAGRYDCRGSVGDEPGSCEQPSQSRHRTSRSKRSEDSGHGVQ